MILWFGNEKKVCRLHFLNLDLNELPSICGRKAIFRNSEPVSKPLVSLHGSQSIAYSKHLDNGFSVSRDPRESGRKQN